MASLSEALEAHKAQSSQMSARCQEADRAIKVRQAGLAGRGECRVGQVGRGLLTFGMVVRCAAGQGGADAEGRGRR